jgi:hypothetical protein
MIRPSTSSLILIPLDAQRRIVTYLDGLPPFRDLRQAKVNAVREFHKGVMLQSTSGAPNPYRVLCEGVLREGVVRVDCESFG